MSYMYIWHPQKRTNMSHNNLEHGPPEQTSLSEYYSGHLNLLILYCVYQLLASVRSPIPDACNLLLIKLLTSQVEKKAAIRRSLRGLWQPCMV